MYSEVFQHDDDDDDNSRRVGKTDKEEQLPVADNPQRTVDICSWYCAFLISISSSDEIKRLLAEEGLIEVARAYLDAFGSFQTPNVLSSVFDNNDEDEKKKNMEEDEEEEVKQESNNRVQKHHSVQIYQDILELLYAASYVTELKLSKRRVASSGVLDLAFQAMISMKGSKKLETQVCRFVAGTLNGCRENQVYVSKLPHAATLIYRLVDKCVSEFQESSKDDLAALQWSMAALANVGIAKVCRNYFVTEGGLELVLKFLQKGYIPNVETCRQILDVLTVLTYKSVENLKRARRSNAVALTLTVMSAHRKDSVIQSVGDSLVGKLREVAVVMLEE